MKTMAVIDRLLKRFGYDAVSNKNRRQRPRTNNGAEDSVLSSWSRNKLTATVRDVQRNFSVASWGIRKHLDYVSTFSFQARTGNDDFDRRLEELMVWWSEPRNCDIRGRDSLARLTRIAEQSRTIDGDCFIVRLNSGHLQAIESDRVASTASNKLPDNLKKNTITQGVILNDPGAAIGYVINRRGSYAGQLTFDKIVRAVNTYHLGYYDRFDQIRGVSRLAASINTFQDLYESLTYALAKTKVAQLFGLVTYRDADSALGVIDTETDSDGSSYDSINFGTGPFHLDLEDGDRAEILESKTPSTETQDFSQIMIAMALKALDIPYSFYAENFSNYSGSRQALLQYEQSASTKRADVQAFLDWVTRWKVQTWAASGILTLPAGMTARNVKWEWINRGIPWIDPLREVKAQVAALEARVLSRQMIAKATGSDWFDIQKQLEQEEKIIAANAIVPEANQNQ